MRYTGATREMVVYFGKTQVFLEWPHNLFSFQCVADARLVYIIVHHNILY